MPTNTCINPPLPTPPEDATPRQVIDTALRAATGPVALACSFSAEDIVVLDMLLEAEPKARVFALDTGRLDEETFDVAEAVRLRYGVGIEWHFPERAAVEALERDKGLFSFRDSLENRHECCRIRKVDPLRLALRGLSAWFTGLRREQSVTRSGLEFIEASQSGPMKVNPLLNWSWEEVLAYAREKGLPLNRLHAKGYPSIGCAPCTRAVAPGEHPRAGRWWWESPEHKECGLHRN